MFGDDSKLRLRRHTNETGVAGVAVGTNSLLPQYNTGGSSNGVSPSTGDSNVSFYNAKDIRKRRRRRQILYKYLKLCLAGLCAAAVTAALSVSLLPFSWTQVDYHHQLENAATSIIQKLEQSRRNHMTLIRGKHTRTERQIVCNDGTIGFENDDYCDCPDGSDEQFSSACSHLTQQQHKFVCKSDRSISIFSSRVNDGIKDCPGGEDEVDHFFEYEDNVAAGGFVARPNPK